MSNNSPAVQGFHIFTNEYLLLIFVRNGEERYIYFEAKQEGNRNSKCFQICLYFYSSHNSKDLLAIENK